MMLKTKNSRPAKVYYAGALPGLLYGAELWGLSGNVKNQLRAEALKVQGLCARGVSNKLVWGVLPSGMDSATKADWMAVATDCHTLFNSAEFLLVD